MVGLLHAMAFMMLLLVDWVIWNNKPLNHWQLSMWLPMTNVSTHCFDYVASTALYSEASSQQRSYFSVVEQVAQASRLQRQLQLFLQDEDNPSLNNSLTSTDFKVITQKNGKWFSHSFLRLLLCVTDPFFNFILTLLTLLTYVWTIRLSCLAMCNLCNHFRPQARAFRVWTTKRFHQLRHYPRPACQENADSATSPESDELRPVPRSARVSVVEPQVAATQPLNEA